MNAYAPWKRYESAERFTSYYTQVDQVLHFSPSTVLEVGVGTGIVTSILRSRGLQVQTLDVDPALGADVVGSVTSIPLPNQSVDVVLCAEVLEHLPWDTFQTSLRELCRIAKTGVVISLPHWGYTVRCIVDVPGLPPIRRAWKLPIHISTPPGEHLWEIGRTEAPLALVKAQMNMVATIESDWISPWMPYHHFFRLRPGNV